MRYLTWVLATLAALFALLHAGAPVAAPFTPTDDAQVLERPPDRGAGPYTELKVLRAALALAPTDVGRATALATGYIRVSRAEGDPRYLGYAQAALGPWWHQPSPPTSVLVLRATIRQSNHDFDSAIADLNEVLRREPRNGQALLTRATVFTVQGKYTPAREDCGRLRGVVAPIYVIVCVASIDSLDGNARAGYESVRQAAAALPRADAGGRAWAESLRGEIAHRLDDRAAEEHFRTALAADPRDLYLVGAYADWLLDQKRPADVLPLVQKETRVDALLLRLALAQQALGRPDAAASVDNLRERFDASRLRGDVVHRREEARFQLHLNGDKVAALALARANWNVQREPADLRVLAEAAAATHDAAALDTVRQWMGETRLEYVAVTRLLGASGRPQ